jgi:hypothetical protein
MSGDAEPPTERTEIATDRGGVVGRSTPQGGVMTAPTQSQTLSSSDRFAGLAGGICRDV